MRSLGEDPREIFDLSIRHPHAAMRGEVADLRELLAAMDQISATDGNLDWPERVTLAARGDYLARIRRPGFIRLRPGRIEDDYLGLAQTLRQRKLLIANPYLVRLN